MTLRPLAAGLTLAALVLSGCRVTSDKNGKNEHVEINSPFGNMNIKTNDGTDTSALGIAIYPGATPWKDPGKDDKDNKDSADINMNFGDFHLGVKAASYRSSDSQDKILDFYKKELARYGDVLTCKGNVTIGQPTRTAQGLTCADDDKKSVHTDATSHNNLELRAGSPSHQHIVGLEQKDGDVRIGLVALDLPTHFGNHSDNPSE